MLLAIFAFEKSTQHQGIELAPVGLMRSTLVFSSGATEYMGLFLPIFHVSQSAVDLTMHKFLCPNLFPPSLSILCPAVDV